MRKVKSERFLMGVLAFAVMGIVVLSVALLNQRAVLDIFAGMGYQPSSEMVEIREKLGLTGKGARIFNASRPVLQEKQEFNQNCREIENELAILGCYRDDKIYVYNIMDEELAGIRELTTAHELLHAVYERMSDEEKSKWQGELANVYQNNQDILGEEIGLYDDGERQEELYVRVGTEISDLPEELERHYGEIFANQDKIVGYYNNYIGVFREIEEKLESLQTEVNALSSEIEVKTHEYETLAESLDREISEFNSCAETANCFSSVAVFEKRWVELVEKQAAFESLYEEINGLIVKHNEMVEEYNEYALHGRELNMVINSSEKP